MNASRAKWQLITTYNEWGKGTAIESCSGCRVTPPQDTYCDSSAGCTTTNPSPTCTTHRPPEPEDEIVGRGGRSARTAIEMTTPSSRLCGRMPRASEGPSACQRTAG